MARQRFVLIVNYGIPPVSLTWLMAGVYLAVALIVVIAAGPTQAQSPRCKRGLGGRELLQLLRPRLRPSSRAPNTSMEPTRPSPAPGQHKAQAPG